MRYGVCPQSIVALRSAPQDGSEMISQLLYGEHFKILEARKKWSRVRMAFDTCEGWVSNLQLKEIPEEEYLEREKIALPCYSNDLISHVYSTDEKMLQPIVLGSVLTKTQSFQHIFEGDFTQGSHEKSSLIKTALLYLKEPYLGGGKTPFGIDSPGFSQMVYRINGYTLSREIEAQSKQGEALSFIEESEAGDLAFFDNEEGIINHVGIILQDNFIIHVYGEVRIDRLDHSGIFNAERRLYTHKLRVIKKVI